MAHERVMAKLREMAGPTADAFARLYHLDDSAKRDLVAALVSYGELALREDKRISATPEGGHGR